MGLIFLNHLAVIIGFNANIEEEVIVEINGVTIACFMPYGLPYQVEVGNRYPSSIEVIALDDIEMQEIQEPKTGFEAIKSSFAYFVKGKFNAEERTIDAGIKVQIDESYLIDYGYLDGKYVQIRVDRININFL